MKFGMFDAYCKNCGVRKIVTANMGTETCGPDCAAEWGRKMARSIKGLDTIGIEERREESSIDKRERL